MWLALSPQLEQKSAIYKTSSFTIHPFREVEEKHLHLQTENVKVHNYVLSSEKSTASPNNKLAKLQQLVKS